MAIHGVLGALAVGILFPLGSILMSVVPGPLALWIHGLAQLFSLTMLIACVGMGIYLVMTFEIPRKDVEEKHLLKNHDTNYHPIMGLAVFFCLLVQPIFGILHHSRFKKLKRRQIWSYFHILNGWVSVTMGIINGALGLSLGPESAKIRRIYIGISAGMWGLWVLSAVWAEVRRRKGYTVSHAVAFNG
ncbi:hypothetical protein QBC47DRAFT_423875 [Echria macrotheca]|uniref:Cytochrome b561 domain-containing protein n=1 Tax=Echria macrotheca TaxID=438768 RepID=A0AAJ0F449_9PEZI|nr:hypothetical protein QBC47DRAFT_423875 [Echria macrotheca]